MVGVARIGVCAAILAAAFLIGWAGWGLHAITHSDKDVRVERTVTGKIVLLDRPGSAGCVRPTDGSADVCGVFYIDPIQPLHSGQQVSIAVEFAIWRGMTFPLLLVYSDPAD